MLWDGRKDKFFFDGNEKDFEKLLKYYVYKWYLFEICKKYFVVWEYLGMCVFDLLLILY